MVICTTDLESSRYCIVWQTKAEFFLLRITNRKGKNDNNFIFSRNLLMSLKVTTVVTRVVTFLNFLEQ